MTVHHARVLALAAVLVGISALGPLAACTGAQQTVDELRALAELGDAEAQFVLGVWHADGRGVLRDDGEAVRWYRLAADQGYDLAQAGLGLMYANGRSVPQDDVEAHLWLNLAAMQGLSGLTGALIDGRSRHFDVTALDAVAERMTADQLAEARRRTRDWTNARRVRVYRLAADQGDATAQFDLGLLYERGRGVPQDYVEAHIWFNLAAAQSSGEDRDNSVKFRDNIAERMTAEQIAEAQRRAQEWTPTPEP